MKNLFFMAMAVGLVSCQQEQIEQPEPAPPQVNDTLVAPTPCTLKLQLDFNPMASTIYSSFEYVDINGIDRTEINPPQRTVDSVDFEMPVRITAFGGNNLDPDVLCNWNLKKDDVVIEVQTVSHFFYEN